MILRGFYTNLIKLQTVPFHPALKDDQDVLIKELLHVSDILYHQLYHFPKTEGRLVTRDFSSHLTVIAL